MVWERRAPGKGRENLPLAGIRDKVLGLPDP